MDGMKHQLLTKRILVRFTALFLCFIVTGLQSVYADIATDVKNAIPATVRPEVVGNALTQQSETTPASMQPVGLPKQPETSLGPQAEKIKFKLVKIILEDNHVYSDATLEKLYQDKLNTVITVAQLQDIVQSITNYYRNNGYILSRAILPPQHIQNGLVVRSQQDLNQKHPYPF